MYNFHLWILVGIIVTLQVEEVHGSCSGNEFECVDKSCIPAEHVNDAISDCEDNSDEGDVFKCHYANQWKCTSKGNALAGVCIDLAQVANGKIDCPDGSDERKIDGSVCRDSGYRLLEPACSDPELGLGEGAGCFMDMTDFKFRCSCQYGYDAGDRGTTCKTRELGDTCIKDSDCSAAMEDAVCADETCQCQTGYVQTALATCTLLVLGDPCTTDEECSIAVNGSACSVTSSSCACISVYFRASPSECAVRNLGESCTSHDQCYGVLHAKCTAARCQCSTHSYKQIGNACIAKELGDSCIAETDCSYVIANSTCDADSLRCACKPGYAAINQSECKQRRIGDACANNLDCSLIPHSECHSPTCQCKRTSYWDSVTQTCIVRHLEGPCGSDQDCMYVIANSTCLGNQCVCQLGFIRKGEMCAKMKINDGCSAHSDCEDSIQNSMCADARCMCQPGFTLNPDKTVCISCQASTTQTTTSVTTMTTPTTTLAPTPTPVPQCSPNQQTSLPMICLAVISTLLGVTTVALTAMLLQANGKTCTPGSNNSKVTPRKVKVEPGHVARNVPDNTRVAKETALTKVG